MAITKIKALGVTANTITASQIANNTITNTQINASAAIAKSKLASLSIVNADVNASAAIDRSKIASQIVVCSYSNVANGGFAATVWEGIPFATEVTDSGNNFAEEGTNNNNAGVFTAPIAGKYLFVVNMIANCTTANRLTAAYIRLVKNTTGNAANGGSELIGSKSGTLVPDSSLATEIAMSTHYIADLAQGNKVWSEFYGNCGAGALRAGDGNFSVARLD